jgi:hypothetical protein
MDDTLIAVNLAGLQCSGQYTLEHVLRCWFEWYQPAGLQLELERASLTVAARQSIVSVACGQVHAYFWIPGTTV